MNSNYKKLDAVMGEDATFKIPGRSCVNPAKSKLVKQMQQIAMLRKIVMQNTKCLQKSDALVLPVLIFNYETLYSITF